jgi:hypothetical protein
MKLIDMELKDSIPTILNTGVFWRYHSSNIVPDFAPQHFDCLDSRFKIYMDYRLPYPYSGRGTKYTIVDFSKKERPYLSFAEFLDQARPEVVKRLLFFVDIF